MRDHAQARVLIYAGVDWARAVLSDDSRRSRADHARETWALRLPPVPVENGELAGHIEDQQSGFNLNNLVRDGKVVPEQLAHFRRLLTMLGLPATLADALADWLDADSEPQPRGGAEDAQYLDWQPPHLAANRLLVDTGELVLVRGFDQAVLARLRPFVTVLPRFTPVNVNTAPPEVLAALIEGLDIDAARSMTAQRDRVYFRDRADFVSRLPKGVKVSEGDVAVGSDFFMAVLTVTMGGAQARGLALLGREGVGWPVVIWQRSF
jgi:general secretion pathway protein K